VKINETTKAGSYLNSLYLQKHHFTDCLRNINVQISCWNYRYVVKILHVSVFCRWFCWSSPTKLLQKLQHLACGLTPNFLTVFLDKLQSTFCIWLLAFSFCKGCEFLFIFLNDRNLITLKMLLELVMQNTMHYLFLHSLNVNSCNWNFTNYIRLLIRTTNL